MRDFKQMFAESRRSSASAWKSQRLQKKLTIGVWLAVLPFTLAGSGIALMRAQRVAISEWETRALRGVELIDFITHKWHNDIIEVLRATASDSNIKSLDKSYANNILLQLKKSRPSHDFAIFKQNGERIANTHTGLPNSQGFNLGNQITRNQEWFHGAIAGWSGSWLTPDPVTQTPYAFGSVPIYEGQKADGKKPIGILASQIRMSKIDESSGLEQIFALTQNAQSTQVGLMDLDHDQRTGLAVLFVMRPGGIHFIGHRSMADSYRNKMLIPSYALQSRWRPFIEIGLESGNKNGVRSIRVDKIDYLVAFKRRDTGSAMLIIDRSSVLRNVNGLFSAFLLVNLAALALSSLAIYRICSALSRPVQQACDALAMISQGNFDTRLPIEQSEIGKLFAYINNTAEQLRSYVATATQHAITESQLAEAKRLQSDFLVKKLPQLKEISLDAYFQPAYEIGADWYDAFRVDDILFLVVADVCDKGIPSALYMSVFRSLLRNNLTNYCAILDSASEIISESIAAVNRYMAENHGVSCMFATIFMAAYTIRDRTLSYIIAGHETPLLMHGSRIEILTLGGPAVGLFADARFSSGHIDIEPGSVLLAYSDGLPDTRNQEGERFGTDRIRNILREHSSEDWSSSRLISRLRESVLEFQGNSEQFDDLTLFAIRVTDTIEEDKFRD